MSRADTDHWHYIVDVIRCIIIGGSGETEWATAELAEAVRSQPSAMVWGQADIVQTAFALLADYRGEHDLAAELFATAANRDLQLVALTVEHLLEQRGLSTDDDWLSVAAELWTRVVPEGARAHALSTANLVSWWSSGVVEAQPEPVRQRVDRPVG
jgi:hypothetical protein